MNVELVDTVKEYLKVNPKDQYELTEGDYWSSEGDFDGRIEYSNHSNTVMNEELEDDYSDEEDSDDDKTRIVEAQLKRRDPSLSPFND